MKIKITVTIGIIITLFSCNNYSGSDLTPRLKLSDNKRYLSTEKGDPFFWLGDTGWMLFSKLSREEAERYFDDRKQKGFNVIQVMVLQNIMKDVTSMAIRHWSIIESIFL
jgi:hypothetical protein